MVRTGAARDVDQLRSSADRLVTAAYELSKAAKQVLAKGDSEFGIRSKLAMAIESVRLHAANVITACNLRLDCERARKILRGGTDPATELANRYVREANAERTAGRNGKPDD